MRTISLAAFLAVLAGAIPARAEEEGEVWVDEEHSDRRVEFMSDGRCFVTWCGTFEQATWTSQPDARVCARAEKPLTLAVEGEKLVDDVDRHKWVRREEFPPAKFPWGDGTPVTLVVTGEQDGQPIAEFEYTYRLSNPAGSYDPTRVRPFSVKSDTGEFTIRAPASCEIDLTIHAREAVAGPGSFHELHLTPENTARRIDVKVKKGVTVTGVATDAVTGKPVAGARIAPTYFAAPMMAGDRSRAVLTDAQGRFTVQGANPEWGLEGTHPDYFKTGCWLKDVAAVNGVLEVAIKFEAGETLKGTVRDAEGLPLEGVKVSDGSGKEMRTGKDGTFVLRSPSKWHNQGKAYWISFEKDGFAELELHPETAEPQGIAAVLERCLTIEGRVLDDKGEPVTQFTVTAGLGVEPETWRCTRVDVKDREGRFRLPLKGYEDFSKSGKAWVGIRASGFAMWDETTAAWKGTRQIEVRLSRGAAVRAKVALPKGAGRVTVRLVPEPGIRDEWGRTEESQRMFLGTLESAVESGAFEIAHVRPGKYSLSVFGERVAPMGLQLTVPDAGLDAGSLVVRGSGSIAGRIHTLPERGGQPWAFASGYVEFPGSIRHSDGKIPDGLKPISFKSDEKGDFRVDGVPAGRVRVVIPYSLTADMGSAHVRVAQVVENEVTEVRFFEPGGAWDVEVKYAIGDGSPAQVAAGTGESAKREVENVNTGAPTFWLELAPKEGGPASWCETDIDRPDGTLTSGLSDVSPGSYRLRVADWLGSRGSNAATLYEAEIVIGPKSRLIAIPLGGGCITGRVRRKEEDHRWPHVMAVDTKSGEFRLAAMDREGDFCIRFLPDGAWLLYAHEPSAGWCRIGEANVKGDALDLGEHDLAPGASIAGAYAQPPTASAALWIQARDTRGFQVAAARAEGGTYALSGLWPETWTLTLYCGTEVLAKATVKVEGTETAKCDLKEGQK